MRGIAVLKSSTVSSTKKVMTTDMAILCCAVAELPNIAQMWALSCSHVCPNCISDWVSPSDRQGLRDVVWLLWRRLQQQAGVDYHSRATTNPRITTTSPWAPASRWRPSKWWPSKRPSSNRKAAKEKFGLPCFQSILIGSSRRCDHFLVLMTERC